MNKSYLCNGCSRVCVLDQLDDDGACPYCGSAELEYIETGPPPEAGGGTYGEWSD